MISIKTSGLLQTELRLPLEATVKVVIDAIRAAGVHFPIKLVYKGHVLRDEQATLQSCKFDGSSSSKLLILKKTEDGELAALETKKVDELSRVQRLEAAVQALAGRDRDSVADDGYYFELENQDGTRIELPAAQRKLLTQGIALHEKAKALARQGKIQNALELMLLSDESFQLCDPRYREMCDNPANLALDIVWLMFRLKDLSRLHDAEHWLLKAQEGFARVHGENLDRILTVRQGFVPERALYARLHILQAVVAFHLGRVSEAASLIHTAEDEVNALKVSSDDLAYLLSLPDEFSEREARMALRACSDREAAVSYAIQQRLKMEETRARRLEEARLDRRARALGRTGNGKLVDVRALDAFSQMGFPHDLVVKALQQTNNDENGTMVSLTDPGRRAALEAAVEQDRLEAALKSSRQASGSRLHGPSVNASSLAQLVSMGFSESIARQALRSAPDVGAASAVCLQLQGQVESRVASADSSEEHTGVADMDQVDEDEDTALDEEPNEDDSMTGHASSPSRAQPPQPAKVDPEAERKRQLDEDILREAQDFEEAAADGGDYLDIPLDEEAAAVAEYKLLILGQIAALTAAAAQAGVRPSHLDQ